MRGIIAESAKLLEESPGLKPLCCRRAFSERLKPLLP
jgi:hypothetical protein